MPLFLKHRNPSAKNEQEGCMRNGKGNAKRGWPMWSLPLSLYVQGRLAAGRLLTDAQDWIAIRSYTREIPKIVAATAQWSLKFSSTGRTDETNIISKHSPIG